MQHLQKAGLNFFLQGEISTLIIRWLMSSRWEYVPLKMFFYLFQIWAQFLEIVFCYSNLWRMVTRGRKWDWARRLYISRFCIDTMVKLIFSTSWYRERKRIPHLILQTCWTTCLGPCTGYRKTASTLQLLSVPLPLYTEHTVLRPTTGYEQP